MIKYIILGIIQGLTEPLPINTTAHISLLKNLLNTKAFNTPLLNIGILISIIIILKDFIKNLLKSLTFYFIKKDKKKYKSNIKELILIIFCSLFISIGKIIFLNKFTITTNKQIIISFILNALLLIFLKKYRKENSQNDKLSYKKAILIGILELIGICPYISQITLTLFLFYLFRQDIKTTFKYTFLIYFLSNFVPIIINISNLTLNQSENIYYIIGIITNTLTSFFIINWLQKLLKNNKIWKLSSYCILIAIFTLIWFR